MDNSRTYFWLIIIIGINNTLQLWTHVLEMLLLITHQNTEFFTTLAQLTQNKANWKNRNHPPWGVGPVSGTCEVILGALRSVWTCPVQDRYWNTGINPAEALPGWSWDWGTKCTRRGCTQGFAHTEEKATGRFYCWLQLLSGRVWEDRSKLFSRVLWEGMRYNWNVEILPWHRKKYIFFPEAGSTTGTSALRGYGISVPEISKT